MSHELRTPLNAIGGYVDLLEMGLRGEVTDAQREDLRRIHHAQRVLVGLVNDVLNFAKIEAGQLEFDIADVPVHEMLDSLEAFVMPQLVARSLDYVYEPVDPALAVRADREKLQQILLNLLSNAIKYTPSPGTIRVSVSTDDDAVLFHVSDTGRGIPSEKCDQIFAPFVRVDTGYSRATEGTGLGLAISRDLARTMQRRPHRRECPRRWLDVHAAVAPRRLRTSRPAGSILLLHRRSRHAASAPRTPCYGTIGLAGVITCGVPASDWLIFAMRPETIASNRACA